MNILPVGTITKLKQDVKVNYVMIIGRFLTATNGKTYDYLGLYYPIGYTSTRDIILFDEDEIEKIIYLGYVNDEGKYVTTRINSDLSNKQ